MKQAGLSSFDPRLGAIVVEWLRGRAAAGEPWQGLTDIRLACVLGVSAFRSSGNTNLLPTVRGLVARGECERRERFGRECSYGRFEVRASVPSPVVVSP